MPGRAPNGLYREIASKSARIGLEAEYFHGVHFEGVSRRWKAIGRRDMCERLEAPSYSSQSLGCHLSPGYPTVGDRHCHPIHTAQLYSHYVQVKEQLQI